MRTAYIVSGVRTPIGRYAGTLASVRPDDLAAHTIRELTHRHPGVDWSTLDDVVLGCANQAGEDNRNVARMASLLAGLPVEVPGTTINRLCASGLDAVSYAARAIAAGDADLVVAGGVESMSRAPFVQGKATTAYSRTAQIYDTTIGWRFVNPELERLHGTDPMPLTGQHVADDYGISRADQDAFALRSQERAAKAQADGRLAREIAPVSVPQRKGDPVVVDTDEHPRQTAEALARLRPLFDEGSVTAGNSSGVNDGAAALLIASDTAVEQYGLEPLARVVTTAAAGVEPRVMGVGPVPAVCKVLARAGIGLDAVGVIELNEAFASQSLAVLRELGLPDDAEQVNPHGGAIALGHPLGILANTDARIGEGKSVTPAFLFAVLLWGEVRDLAQQAIERGQDSNEAWERAATKVVGEQCQRVAIPRRFTFTMEEIWSLQPRFEQIQRKRVFRLMAHPRFRAAFDFLLLRADESVAMRELGQWWAHAQQLPQEVLAAALPAGGGPAAVEPAPVSAAQKPPRPRRRRRKRTDKPGSV